MTSKTHNVMAFAGLMTATIWYVPTQLKPMTIVVALVANIVGALMPDLDQASNRLWDLLPGGNTVGKIMRNMLLGHRTISHSLIGVYLVFRLTDWLVPGIFNSTVIDTDVVLGALLIGYVTHLAGDGLTEGGLPLLWPLKWKFGFPPVRSWRIKSGRWFEKYVIFPGVIIYIGLIGWNFRWVLLKILAGLG